MRFLFEQIAKKKMSFMCKERRNTTEKKNIFDPTTIINNIKHITKIKIECKVFAKK